MKKILSLLRKFKSLQSDAGMLMIESILAFVATTLVVSWSLPIGLMQYPRFLLTVYTNDAAKKIANTYYEPQRDMITGYFNKEDIKQRALFLALDKDNLDELNGLRAENYIRYQLNRLGVGELVNDLVCFVRVETDGVLRKHVDLATTCTYKLPLWDFVKTFRKERPGAVAAADAAIKPDQVGRILGMGILDAAAGDDDGFRFAAVSHAECTEIAHYINTVDGITGFISSIGSWSVSKVLNCVNSIYKYARNAHYMPGSAKKATVMKMK